MNLTQLYTILKERQAHPHPESYTARLLAEGLPRIAQKVGEEATEVVVATLSQDDRRLTEEIADLAYHVLVLMVARGLTPEDIAAELERRHR
ncbi:MAG TPA: phosphoribosyl-ATP diphosphatase [Anaerolineae bacterium]|nr:phosphoribosyl-ATP diphosphatase [Anaerolineae bacterium]HID83761.1 phosphoribosyl-ATP diphosphatase [Anaerolineales bacterium]HIQ09055.1 phosphoribosyl-ATP diphosphatase [Anaerolineaceae bacterium]